MNSEVNKNKNGYVRTIIPRNEWMDAAIELELVPVRSRAPVSDSASLSLSLSLVSYLGLLLYRTCHI